MISSMIISLSTSIGTIALVCMGMVFFALSILLVIYLLIPKLLDAYFNNREKLSNKIQKKENSKEETQPLEGNVNAAIAMALYLMDSELHDDESNIITIDQIKKTYSPWSSKIYGVMNNQL